jgi:methylglutaconyl-CoA hydratase
MTTGTTILIENQGSVATIWLNRPGVHNALNGAMISEFREAMQRLNTDPEIRIIVIRGKGPGFCAGADLLWMQQAARLAPEENYQECYSLARCFSEIATSPKITLALIHGSAIGGACGLIAAADLALATESAEFAFSEVRLGLVPATIAPYVIRKIGRACALELMLTGRKFDAREAALIGFITRTWPDDDFDAGVSIMLKTALSGRPMAQRKIKALLNEWPDASVDESLVELTARLIAEVRVSEEAKEGISAFLQKQGHGVNDNHQN